MAARFCPQCGQEVSSAAKFCPNCAASLVPAAAASPAPAPLAPVDAAARNTRKLLLPAALVALVVLTVALVLAQRKPQPSVLVSAPAPVAPAPAVTDAPVTPPAPAPAVTNAPVQPPAAPGPAVTNAPAQPAPTLPADVATYLNFLQGIEQKRIAMSNDVSGAMTMMTVAQGMQGAGTDPEGNQDTAKQGTQKLSQGYADYAVKWQGLIRDFRATPAPSACTGLANGYLKYLSDYSTVITKLQVALLNHDSSGLPDMSGVGQVQAQVNADGTSADGELTQLCARYGVPKPFAIGADTASPSLLGH